MLVVKNSVGVLVLRKRVGVLLVRRRKMVGGLKEDTSPVKEGHLGDQLPLSQKDHNMLHVNLSICDNLCCISEWYMDNLQKENLLPYAACPSTTQEEGQTEAMFIA